MGLTWADLEDRIQKLTDDYRDTGDRFYRIECSCGVLLGTTKVSRKQGRAKNVGYPILKQIPRQLVIDAALWREISGCTKGRDHYLVARGHEACLPPTARP